MIGMILSRLRDYKNKKYLNTLIRRGLQLGNDTHIMDGVFLDPSHCFLISIGNHCTLAPNVRIMAHDASMKDRLGVTKVARVIIGDHCFIGDSAILLPGVAIGSNVIIGAGSVVTRDVPADSVAAGNPARVIASFDEFVKRHSENREKKRCFPEDRFDIAVLSERDKEEMLASLEKQVGYMEGR